MTSTGGPASWSCAARAAVTTGCRCPPTSARRSPPICGAGGPAATGGRCSCGRRRRLGPLARGDGRRRSCAARAGGRGSPRSARTACATRLACEMVVAGVPLAQIGQVLRHRSLQSTAIYARVDVDRLRLLARPGRRGASRDERPLERPRRGLPAAAPGAGVQARARRAAAAAARRLPRGRRRGDDHQRAGDRLGAAAGTARSPINWAQRLGHRARVRPLPADDRPGHRGAAAPACSPASAAARPRTCGRRARSAACSTAARALRPPLRAATHEALFGLLAVSGMRLGEAIGLERDDVDLDAGVITIRRGKFDRSRLVPLHPTADRGAARATPRDRDRLCPRPRSETFFVSSVGTALDRSGVDKTFSQLTTAHRAAHRDRAAPRIHDLRHSFAVEHPDPLAPIRGRRRRAASPCCRPTSGTSTRPTPTGICPPSPS